MHVPKGKPVHEYLKTSYVNTAALLADLQVSGFTGYLQISFPLAQSYIFINEGTILNALEESEGRARNGTEAIHAILLRASSPDGIICIYTHTKAVIEAIASRIEGAVVYQALESEFTDLRKLVTKLLQQQDQRFYLEIKLGAEGEGIIYTTGAEVEAMISLPTGEIIEGEEGYERLLAICATSNATFDVYRCNYPSLAATTGNVISFPEPLPTTMVATPLRQPTEKLDQAAELEEEDTEEVDETTYQREYQGLISLMGEVIQTFEHAAAPMLKEGSFLVALRGGLLSVAENYPFFDPFAAEFEYLKGEIKFSASPPPIDFIIGLTQALQHTLKEMERSAPLLRQAVVDAFSKLQKLRNAELNHFGLAPALAEIISNN